MAREGECQPRSCWLGWLGWLGWLNWLGWLGYFGWFGWLACWLVGLLARWLVDLQVCRFVGFLGCVPDFECKQREQVSEQLNVRT